MTSNIFREYSEVIKDHYIVSFVGEEHINRYYVKSSLPQEWIQSFKHSERESISVSDHEKRLISYFENPKLRNTRHPLMLVVGGVGSGKSSSIMYAMHKANVCKGCVLEKTCKKNYPDRIIINYLNFTKNLDHDHSSSQELVITNDIIDKFWLHIIKALDESLDESFNMETELKSFWPWLTKYKCNYLGFYDFIDMHKEEINDPDTPFDRLRSLRDKFRSQLNKKDLAYYKLYQITFLREERIVKCNFLLFDNIDTLPPVLQNELVKFSEEAYILLGSKSILLVRPLTYMRNKDASDFIERIDHAKANLKDVFLKRLERLKKDKDLLKKSNLKNVESFISCLEKAIHLIPDNNLYRKIFVATSGRSIRFGLRNFYNFLLSPNIVTHIDGIELNEIKIDSNVFFQAYFCGENQPQYIDEDNFINLVSISHSSNVNYLSNIKIRILDILIKKDTTQVNELVNILKDFGYEIYNIGEAINDMLKNRKALMWSTHLIKYDTKDLLNTEDHFLRLTDLGFRYYSELMKYVNYLRECLYPIYKKRTFGGANNVAIVYNALIELEDEDMNQIRSYILNCGLTKYKILYPESENSLSLTIWNKIKDDILFHRNRHPNIEIDAERENYIKKRVIECQKDAEKDR